MLGKALIGLGVGTATLGLGAAAGAYAGQTENNAMTGATVGAATGLGLGVGAIAIGANADKIAGGIGKGVLTLGKKGMKLGKKAWGFASSETTQNALIDGAKSVGQGAVRAGKVGAHGVGAAANIGAISAVKAGAKYGNIAASMFKINPDFKNLDGGKGNMFKLTKRGATMVGIGTAVSAGVSAFKAFDGARAGVSDGQVMTATPVAARSSGMRNAGATGDLAFAMSAQRHG